MKVKTAKEIGRLLRYECFYLYQVALGLNIFKFTETYLILESW